MKRRALLLLPAFFFALPALAAPRAKSRIAIVPVAGAPVAREVANELTQSGFAAEVVPAGALPALALPIEPAKACIAEGHQAAFRLDYAGAIKSLTECDEKFGAALARPEGIATLSALLVETAAAQLGSGDKERARNEFVRLARLGDAAGPDPSIFPPDVMALWEEARRELPLGKPVTIEAVPPWATLWIDGRKVAAGEKLELGPGAHYALAEAAGFAPTATTVMLDSDATATAVRLTALEPDARHASVRAAAATIPPTAPGAAEELTAAFGAPVLFVGAKTGAAEGVLLIPAERGGAAAQVSRFRPAGTQNPARAIASATSSRLAPSSGPRDPSGPTGPTGPIVSGPASHRTLYIVAGSVAGALAVGAAAYAVNNQSTKPGPKDGSVTWQP